MAHIRSAGEISQGLFDQDLTLIFVRKGQWSKYVHIINLQMQKALNRVPFAGQSAQNIHSGFS